MSFRIGVGILLGGLLCGCGPETVSQGDIISNRIEVKTQEWNSASQNERSPDRMSEICDLYEEASDAYLEEKNEEAYNTMKDKRVTCLVLVINLKELDALNQELESLQSGY